MICVVDQSREADRPQVCTPCRNTLPGLLDDIVGLWAVLDITPGTGGHQPRVAGSREAPLPLRVDPLDLAMPARGGTVHDPHGDQCGQIAVATILDQAVDDWRDQRNMREHRPVPTVPVLAAWLVARIDWACDEHPAVDEWVAEMRSLRRTLRLATGQTDARPERLFAPCPSCDLRALVRDPAAAYPVECANCGRRMTEDEYADWSKLVANYERTAA